MSESDATETAPETIDKPEQDCSRSGIENQMGIQLDGSLQASQQAEAELREREERLQMSLDAANVGTWEWNIRTGKVRWSENLERIHGQEPGGFRGTFQGF